MYTNYYTYTIFFRFHIVPASSDIDCGDPGTPTNDQRFPFSTVYTSEVLYYCSLGYTLQGSDRRTCQSNGEWNGHLPKCTCMFSSFSKKGIRWYLCIVMVHVL